MKECVMYSIETLKKFHKLQSIVYKITDSCNLSCKYCYRDINILKRREVMPLETIKKSFVDYRDLVLTNPKHYNKRVYLIWHGGEPLIPGVEYYKKIVELEKEIFPSDFIIENAIQTNGTMIDNLWVELFEKGKFSVGISLDGPKHLHDLNRTFKNGKSSFELTIKGINQLKKSNLRWSVISVITEPIVQHVNEIYNFYKKIEIPIVDVIPCYYYDGSHTLPNEQYSEFMIKLFDLWRKDLGCNVVTTKIRFLNDIRQKLLSKKEGKVLQTIGCELAGFCGCNFSLGVNGDVYPCECLTPITKTCIGNIHEKSLIEIINSEKFASFLELFNAVDIRCKDCSNFDVCMAGCLNRRMNTTVDYYCKSRHEIISHIGNSIDSSSA